MTGDELVARLRSADETWTTAQGTSRHWRRQDLVSAAFARHFEHPHRRPSWTMSALRTTDDRDVVDDEIVEAVLAVAFDARGGRRRAQVISRHREEWLPDLIVYDGPTFWARTGDVVDTNDGDGQRSHGGTDIVKLLLPSRVPDGYHITPLAEQEQIAGRSCVMATAVPREPDPFGRTPGSEVFDMIAGGTVFRLGIDRETGVLLRVVKLVDDAEAEICEFLDITFGATADDRLFAALT